MTRRILAAALIAGLIAGVAVTAFQAVRLVPLILAAEQFETTDDAEHAHDAAIGWAPAEGLERLTFTGLANVLTACGFGLLLLGGMALRYGASGRVDWRIGLAWGAAGFAAFALAPALGLPPELPGSAAASLAARQAWWVGTAAATAGGIALIAFARGAALRVAGAVLIVVPHLVGAPVPDHHGGSAPPELAAEFAVASLAAAALFWAVLGGCGGWLYGRLSRS